MVGDGASSHKIDYFSKFKEILHLKGHQNRITGTRDTAIFAEWVDFAYWGSCIGKGLRPQPAQQACLFTSPITTTNP